MAALLAVSAIVVARARTLSGAPATEPDYSVAFEMSWRTVPWWFPALGPAFLVASLVFLSFLGRRAARQNEPFPIIGREGFLTLVKVFKYVTVGFCLLATWVASTIVFPEYFAVRRAYEGGQSSVAEGKVEKFVERLGCESFTVQGVKFEYADHVGTSGFHVTRSRGGPMQEDLQVRIHDVRHSDKTVIVKLEIADEGEPPLAQ